MARGPPARTGLPQSVQISKALSRLLRHAAVQERIPIDKAGYVRMDHLLGWQKLKAMRVGFEDVVQVVRENEKRRFGMRWDGSLQGSRSQGAVGENEGRLVEGGGGVEGETGDGKGEGEAESAEENLTQWATTAFTEGVDTDPKHFYIRATQGHSMADIESEGLLTPITLESASTVPETIVHGTFYGSWELILKSGGLKKMNRNHVHFATGPKLDEVLRTGDGGAGKVKDGVLSKEKVISGMRADAQILIYIDVRKALGVEGWSWWRSENGVVLTNGLEVEGERGKEKMVPLKYWDVVVEVKQGLGVLWRQDQGVVRDLPQELKTKGVPRGKKGGGRGGGRGGGDRGRPKLMVERDDIG